MVNLFHITRCESLEENTVWKLINRVSTLSSFIADAFSLFPGWLHICSYWLLTRHLSKQAHVSREKDIQRAVDLSKISLPCAGQNLWNASSVFRTEVWNLIVRYGSWQIKVKPPRDIPIQTQWQAQVQLLPIRKKAQATPRSGRFEPGKDRYFLYRRMGCPQGPVWTAETISSATGIDPRKVQRFALPTTLFRPAEC